MRSPFAIVFVALAGAVGAPFAQEPRTREPAEEEPVAIESWDIPGVGLRLSVPRRWVLASDPSARTLTLLPPEGRGQIAVVASPLPSTGDGIPDLEAAADSAVASLKESVRKFKLLSRREVEIAARPGVELYFRGRVEGAKFRWIQTLLVQAGRQVILMYAAPDETYGDHLGDYDQLLRSIRPAG